MNIENAKPIFSDTIRIVVFIGSVIYLVQIYNARGG